MLKNLTLSLLTLLLVLTPAFVLGSTRVDAQTASSQALCEGANDGTGNSSCTDDTSGTAVSNVIKTAIRIFQAVIGILAIFYILIGGLSYITSGGDAAKTKSAREKILYAMIGLVIVAVAEILVRFALNRAYGL
jgi:hypothetical protein